MLGAIIGDIIGSTYEFNPIKSKEFELFSPGSRPTDDTVMTVAVGLVTAASDCTDEERYRQDLIRFMRLLGREYPDAGYGKRFIRWLNEGNGAAYHSYGNGSAMRVSPVGWRARTLAEAEQLARWSAEVTHDHPDGIRGAQAVASAIFLARTTHDKKRIRGHIASYYYPMEFRLDRIRASYRFDATCPRRRSSVFLSLRGMRMPCAMPFRWAATPTRRRASPGLLPRRTTAFLRTSRGRDCPIWTVA